MYLGVNIDQVQKLKGPMMIEYIYYEQAKPATRLYTIKYMPQFMFQVIISQYIFSEESYIIKLRHI